MNTRHARQQERNYMGYRLGIPLQYAGDEKPA